MDGTDKIEQTVEDLHEAYAKIIADLKEVDEGLKSLLKDLKEKDGQDADDSP